MIGENNLLFVCNLTLIIKSIYMKSQKLRSCLSPMVHWDLELMRDIIISKLWVKNLVNTRQDNLTNPYETPNRHGNRSYSYHSSSSSSYTSDDSSSPHHRDDNRSDFSKRTRD